MSGATEVPLWLPPPPYQEHAEQHVPHNRDIFDCPWCDWIEGREDFLSPAAHQRAIGKEEK